MGRKLWLDPLTKEARVDRRKHRALDHEPLARVHQANRYIHDAVKVTDCDDTIVARAKELLRGPANLG